MKARVFFLVVVVAVMGWIAGGTFGSLAATMHNNQQKIAALSR